MTTGTKGCATKTALTETRKDSKTCSKDNRTAFGGNRLNKTLMRFHAITTVLSSLSRKSVTIVDYIRRNDIITDPGVFHCSLANLKGRFLF